MCEQCLPSGAAKILAIFLLFAALSARCAEAAENLPATSRPPAIVPPATPPTKEVKPQEDGWDTEVFTEAADAQLKSLLKLLESPATIEAAAGKLVQPEIATTRLRAIELETAYSDTAFTVRRLAKGKPPAAIAARGTSAFVAAVRELAELLSGSLERHTKTKIFRVTKTNDGVTTLVYFQIGAKFKDRSLQINATWSCDWAYDAKSKSPAPPMLRSIALTDYEQIDGKTPAGPMFADCTEAVLRANTSFDEQLRHSIDRWTGSIEASFGIDIGGWQGLAIGDVNGDGLDDVYFAQPGGLPNRLFLQNADGTATDVSSAWGVDVLDATHAALFVDLDNDGDQDLVQSVEQGVLIMANDEQRRFVVRSAIPLPAAIPYSFAAADYDRDGDLDLYVCCYNPRAGINRHILFARPVPYYDANNGGPNVMLRNDATSAAPRAAWVFTPVTKQLGLDENNRKFSYAACWDDYDNDGDQDLFVTNDFGRDNLYRNDNGLFRDVARDAGVDDVGPGMSCCWGDYDNDGLMDLYVANMFSSAGNRVSHQARFHADADAATKAALRHHARGNSLYRNQGNGKFADVSLAAHVAVGRWAWGSKFVDINNDGYQDVVVTNGFITQEGTRDL